MDKATSARIVLEKHLEHLEVELAFLQRVHKEVMHVWLSSCSILLTLNESVAGGWHDFHFIIRGLMGWSLLL